MISIAIRHVRHTLKGIKENMIFSVNIPSVDLIKETDYCGLVSGSKMDKIKTCKFTIFYGTLKKAPLIEQCPVNLECKVVHTMNNGSHELILGTIEEVHVTDTFLTDGKPDADKIKPLLYCTGNNPHYSTIGADLGKAFSIGKML